MTDDELNRLSPSETWERTKKLCRHPGVSAGASLVALCVAGDGLVTEHREMLSILEAVMHDIDCPNVDECEIVHNQMARVRAFFKERQKGGGA